MPVSIQPVKPVSYILLLWSKSEKFSTAHLERESARSAPNCRAREKAFSDGEVIFRNWMGPTVSKVQHSKTSWTHSYIKISHINAMSNALEIFLFFLLLITWKRVWRWKNMLLWWERCNKKVGMSLGLEMRFWEVPASRLDHSLFKMRIIKNIKSIQISFSNTEKDYFLNPCFVHFVLFPY